MLYLCNSQYANHSVFILYSGVSFNMKNKNPFNWLLMISIIVYVFAIASHWCTWYRWNQAYDNLSENIKRAIYCLEISSKIDDQQNKIITSIINMLSVQGINLPHSPLSSIRTSIHIYFSDPGLFLRLFVSVFLPLQEFFV